MFLPQTSQDKTPRDASHETKCETIEFGIREFGIKEHWTLTHLEKSDHCFVILSLRNDSGVDVTDILVYKEWEKTKDKLLKMGEERGEKDVPSRDMPASTGLKILGWRSNTPLKKTLAWFEIDFEYGESDQKVSLNNMGSLGDDLFITDQRGIWTLFSDFYSSFADKILLNKTVTTIEYDDNGVEVATAGGETFTADYALCTFGSGVLNRGSVQFNPPLPGWKKEAIYRLRPVYYTKIFLKFPSEFWGDSEWTLHVSSQNTGHFPVFFDLDRAGFFPGSNSLYTVVTGDESLRVEAQDDSKTMEELMEVLRNMYGPSIPNATGTERRVQLDPNLPSNRHFS